MSYTAPASYNLANWARDVVTPPNNVVVCCVNNSLAADTNSTPPITRGIHRTWRVTWAARGSRNINGPTAWSSSTAYGGTGVQSNITKATKWAGYATTTVTVTDAGSTANLLYPSAHGLSTGNTIHIAASSISALVGTWNVTVVNATNVTIAVDPGAAGTAEVGSGASGAFPVTGFSLQASFNLSGNTMFTNDLADADNYAGGNPFSGVQVYGRLIYRRDQNANVTGNSSTGMLPFAVKPRRNGSSIGTAVNADYVGSPVITYTDVDCGTGSGLPGLSAQDIAGQTEITKWAFFGSVKYWIADGNGVQIPGMTLYDIATGGDNQVDTLHLFDDTVVPRANVRGYFFANGWPTHILVYAPIQNQTSAEATDFGNGLYAVAKTNLRAWIDALFATYDSDSRPHPKVLIDVGHQTGYSDADMELRAKACYEVAREIGGSFHNSFAVGPKNIVGVTGCFTADDVHFANGGESVYMALLWRDLVASVTSSNNRPRIRRKVNGDSMNSISTSGEAVVLPAANSTSAALAITEGFTDLATLRAAGYGIVSLAESGSYSDNNIATSACYGAAKIRFFGTGAADTASTYNIWAYTPSGVKGYVTNIGTGGYTLSTLTGSGTGATASAIPATDSLGATNRIADTVSFTLSSSGSSTTGPWTDFFSALGATVSTYSPANNTSGYLIVPELGSATHLIVEFAKGTATSCNASIEKLA